MFKEIELTPPELVEKVLSGVDIYCEKSDLSDILSLDEHGQIRWVNGGELLAISNELKSNWYIKVDWKDSLNDTPQWCWCWGDCDKKEKHLILVSRYDPIAKFPFSAKTGFRFTYAELATKDNCKSLIDQLNG